MKEKDVLQIVLNTIGCASLCGAFGIVIKFLCSLNSSFGIFVFLISIAIASFAAAGIFNTLDHDPEDDDAEDGEGGSK